ncbi:MAG: hypothetical protein IJS09_05745, partial [Treponema sp.]|nr:hypothetical protein [Treponema sp.]
MKRFFCFFVYLFAFSVFCAENVAPEVDYYYDGTGFKADSVGAVCGRERLIWPNHEFTGGYSGGPCFYQCHYSDGSIHEVFTQFKCPYGYFLGNVGICRNNDVPQCISRCIDGMYWDGSICKVIPNCPGNSLFNPQTEECETKCPSNLKKDFSVPIGYFPADYNNYIDIILARTRSALGSDHCLNGCLFAANKNLSIHPTGIKDSAGNLLYIALFSGSSLSQVCTGDNWNGDDYHHGGDNPPEEEKKCKVPGTRWSELAKACLCKDGLEPADGSCVLPFEDEPDDSGGSSGDEGSSGEGGSGEGGSGGG